MNKKFIENLVEAYEKLKQQCDELKKQYNCYACGTCNGKEDYRNLERHHIGLRKSFDELHKQLDQLKAENDELEKWKKEHLKDVEFIEGNPVIDILNSMADNILLEQRNEKLKQTLTEIKEIAETCNYKNILDVIERKDYETGHQ